MKRVFSFVVAIPLLRQTKTPSPSRDGAMPWYHPSSHPLERALLLLALSNGVASSGRFYSPPVAAFFRQLGVDGPSALSHQSTQPLTSRPRVTSRIRLAGVDISIVHVYMYSYIGREVRDASKGSRVDGKTSKD